MLPFVGPISIWGCGVCDTKLLSQFSSGFEILCGIVGIQQNFIDSNKSSIYNAGKFSTELHRITTIRFTFAGVG